MARAKRALEQGLSHPLSKPWGGLVARLEDRPPHVHPEEDGEAEQKERRQRKDRDPVAPRELQRQTEEERPEPTRPPLAHLVQAEVLRLLPLRDHVRVERAAQRLASAEHERDHRAEDEKLSARPEPAVR